MAGLPPIGLHRDLRPLGRGPDTDDVVAAVVELRQRHLQRDRVHRVAGEEIPAAAAGTRAAADRHEVERRADVTEEPVVTLTREDLGAVAEVVDAGHRQRVVVRRRARADVVGRREQPVPDDALALAVEPCDGVLLLCVLQECDRRAVLEPEPPRQVGLAVPVLVGVDHVPGRRRERVPVRSGGGVFTRDVVGDDRHGARLVRAPERVGVGVVRGGVLRDQRGLPVARSLGCRGAPAPRRERHDQRCRGCGRQESECELSHRPVAPFNCVGRHVGPDSHDAPNRFGPMSEYRPMARTFAHLSDEAIVALVARSDEEALAELYDRFGRVAYGLALRVLRDDKLAEDAVQEGFLTAWRNADRFMPERAKASTWILTLVHRRAVDLVRREDRPRPSKTMRGCASNASVCKRHFVSYRTSSGRRSSSPTTAASANQSLRRGSANPSVRSRAGCSRALRACANCWQSPATEKRHGSQRPPRPDRCVRARRPRRRRRARVRGAPFPLRPLPGRAGVAVGGRRCARLRDRGADAAAGAARAHSPAGPARASERRAAPPSLGRARRRRCRGCGVCGDRAGHLGRVAGELPRSSRSRARARSTSPAERWSWGKPATPLSSCSTSSELRPAVRTRLGSARAAHPDAPGSSMVDRTAPCP